ncbi:PQ-loop repeat-containing protein [Actinotalea sp. BY-33]|uniref:PQ-loop repeat-containing protein n=1 Tax=Actinotalea soli TaxID=2819234 RepID=A0A939LP39_9CELL|nr:PQ-loop repeat-containing protein [Actinotalea soli]MBO1751214.1 PQ-loop repeat-containing protein [Actinotalea soli]
MEYVVQLITEASGFLASITGFLVWLPQARRVWRDRKDPARLAGVSIPTQVLSLAGNVLWFVHAIGIGSFWLGAPSVINVPVILLTIYLVRRSQTAAIVNEGLQALVPEEMPDGEEPVLAEMPVLEAALTADVDPADPEVASAVQHAEDFARAV